MDWWHPRAIVLTGLTLAGLACKPATGPNDGDSPSSVVFPPSNVSYALQVQPLFSQTCALVGCHDDATAQKGLKLTSWGNTRFSVPGIIIEGQPENSTLIFRIEGRVGERMPSGRNPLNQNQINGIRAWIAEGAKNN